MLIFPGEGQMCHQIKIPTTKMSGEMKPVWAIIDSNHEDSQSCGASLTYVLQFSYGKRMGGLEVRCRGDSLASLQACGDYIKVSASIQHPALFQQDERHTTALYACATCFDDLSCIGTLLLFASIRRSPTCSG